MILLIGQMQIGISGLPYNTYWAAGTDLALQKVVTLSSPLNSAVDVTLNAASDNGFAVFVNDTMIAKEMAEGYTTYWEYTLSIDSSYFSAGDNVVQVFAEDHGGATFFDMMMVGDTNSVPEPATMLLFGSLLICFIGITPRRSSQTAR